MVKVNKRYSAPRKVADKNNPLEKQEGMASTSWVRSHYPEVVWAHIANEGQEKKLSEGLVPGFPDYMLCSARGGYAGLFIELKRRKTGSLSDSQKTVGASLLKSGYAWACCAGLPEVKEIVNWYMNLPTNQEIILSEIPVTKHQI